MTRDTTIPASGTAPGPSETARAKEPDIAEKEEQQEEKEAPVDRWVEAVPFLFGGALAVYFGFSLHAAPTRSGTVPYWVLAFALGIIALVAGVLLLLAPSGGEADDEEEEEGDHIAVPRKEWERVTQELERLKKGEGDATEASTPPTPP